MIHIPNLQFCLIYLTFFYRNNLFLSGYEVRRPTNRPDCCMPVFIALDERQAHAGFILNDHFLYKLLRLCRQRLQIQ